MNAGQTFTDRAGGQDEIDRVAGELRLASAARPQDASALATALQAAAGLVERSARAAEEFALEELHSELSEVYEQLGRTEDALTAMRQAIAAGYRSSPDPQCRLAEILLRAGRAEEAHPIFAELYREDATDVWLFNNAGLEYGIAGDHRRALGWLDEGLDLAMRTGDPEQLVAQLADLRREQLTAAGREPDDLDARADAFLADPPPRPARSIPRLAAASGSAAASSVVASGRARVGAAAHRLTGDGTTRRPVSALAFAWFPADEFTLALARWPELAERWGAEDHQTYSRGLQRRLVDTDTAGAPGQLWVAPIKVAIYLDWCDREGRDPATGDSRAGYAAERVRTVAEDLIPWPPPRNAACWCGPGRKYKQCCGHPAALADPAVP